MRTFLKNYTSSVPVSKTITRIEQVLIRCGVTGIMKEYGDTNGKITAITFQMPLDGQNVTVRLPADENAALEALWHEYMDGKEPLGWDRKRKKKSDFREQAERTAWKLVQDWVEVEMSRLQLRQGDMREIFLSYIWDGKQTFFQAVQASGFKGLLPEKTGQVNANL